MQDLLGLPGDVFIYVLGFLDCASLTSSSMVSKSWRSFACDRMLWAEVEVRVGEAATDTDVSNLVARHSSIRKLQLASSKLTTQGLAMVARQLVGLRELTFVRCSCLRQDFYNHLPILTGLHTLSFQDNDWIVTDVALAQLLPQCTSLRRIFLPRCYRLTDATLETLGHNCPLLGTIDLSGCRHITPEGLKSLAAGCPRVRKLRLAGCVMIDDDGLHALSRGMVYLRSLSLHGLVEVEDEGVMAVVEACTSLSQLHLKYCDRITNAAVNLIATCCTDLETLSLGGCRSICDEAVAYLAEGCKKLRYLSLEMCNVRTRESMQALSSLPCLQTLVLGLCPVTDDSLIALCKGAPSLRHLKLDHCLVTSAALSSLHALPALTELTLAWCNLLGDDGMRLLPPRLRSLDLSWTSISDVGVASLAQTCPSLACLKLAGCYLITGDSLETLATTLPHLKALNVRKAGVSPAQVLTFGARRRSVVLEHR